MAQKEKVLNLFGFLMDLLEEPTESKEPVKLEEEQKTKSTVGQTSDVKVLSNPSLPHHPVLNPFTLESLRKADDAKAAKGVSKLKSAIPRSLELIKEMDKIDKKRADELMKTRLVSKVTKPYIHEIEELRNKYVTQAVEAKEKEEIETIIDEVGEKLGITLVNGKIEFIQLPNKLRDNIPLEEESNVEMGVSVKKDGKGEEIKGLDDLPKEIREKLELKDSLKDSKMPEAIKEAIVNAPSVPIESVIKKKVTRKPTKRKTRKSKK